LVNIISVKDFSDIYLFSSQKEAEAYRQKKKLDLIIWGSFSADGLKIDGEKINKVILNFTYSCPRYLQDKENQLGKAIVLDISHKLAIKNYWKIVDNNSLRDIQIVSNNLNDISFYIIGLTLKFYGRIKDSVEIFEKLYANLMARNDSFSNLIVPHLLDCYWLFVRDIILTRNNYIKGRYFCEKILKLDEKNHFALANLAHFLYILNEKDRSEKIVEKLLEFYPRDPITEVDVAFIRIMQKNYKNAFNHYNRLTQMQAISFNPQDTIEFLGQEYQKSKEPALLYGSAILSYYWGDKLLAKEDFIYFLKKANENSYKEMYRKAKNLLDSI
ncbi:MAG: hypothetical protein Q8P10_00515, partial [bacterium]|nr:hypothetical protein [bacterium]